MDFVYIWYGYRCWSKRFLGTIYTPAHDLEVKVLDLDPYKDLISKSLYGFNLYLAWL